MAKVINPLFSLSATGSIGKLITFKSTKNGAVVTRKAPTYKQQSVNQLEHQQIMRNAVTAFRILSIENRAEWNKVSLRKAIPTWQAFYFEYQQQGIQSPNFPLIPEGYIL